jgi:hypothetical protein
VRTILGAIKLPEQINSAFLESLSAEVQIETTYGASFAGSLTSVPKVTAFAGDMDKSGIKDVAKMAIPALVASPSRFLRIAKPPVD